MKYWAILFGVLMLIGIVVAIGVLFPDISWIAEQRQINAGHRIEVGETFSSGEFMAVKAVNDSQQEQGNLAVKRGELCLTVELANSDERNYQVIVVDDKHALLEFVDEIPNEASIRGNACPKGTQFAVTLGVAKTMKRTNRKNSNRRKRALNDFVRTHVPKD